MKTTHLLKTMLLLCALIVGANSWATEKTKWIKTAPANLKADNVVVIVDVTKSVAIVNNPSSGKSPSATSVTLNDAKDQLSVDGDLDTKFQWTLEEDKAGDPLVSTGKCRFKVGDNYLFVTTKDDGLRVGTPAEGDVKAFGLTKDEAHDNAEFLGVVMSETENRYVGVKNQWGSNSWKTPTSINDDIKDTRIAFFKKVVTNKADAELSWSGTTAGSANVDLHPTGSNTFPELNNPNSLTGITYSSSNEWVASINASGVITLKKRGTVTITASRAEDETYDAASVSYTLRIDDSSSEEGTLTHPFSPSQAITYSKTDGNVNNNWTYFVTGRVSKIGAASSTVAIPGTSTNSSTDGTLTYYISDDGRTGVDGTELQISSGRYTGYAELTDRMISVGDIVTVAGSLVLSSSSSSIGGGIGGGSTGTGTGTKTLKMDAGNYIHAHTPVLSTVDKIINNGVVKGQAEFYTIDNDNVNGTLGAITLESKNTDIASYNSEGMTLTANKIGETVITVKAPVTLTNETSYTMESKFTLTVQSRDVAPESSGNYQLVTDVASLQNGDRILIVGPNEDKWYALSTKQNDTDRGSKEVTVSENTISTVPDDAQVITLEKDGDNYYFNTGSAGYLYASSSSEDELKSDTKPNAGDNAKATIAIDGTSNDATITFQGTNTHNTIRFDCFGIMGYIISSSFACYESGYTVDGDENTAVLPKIYRFVQDDHFTIKTGGTGYKTLVSSLDVASLPEGLKAYIVKTVGTDNVTTEVATTIKAGEPYILKGTANTNYTLYKTSDAVTAPGGNLLRVSDSSTANGVYVLATPKGGQTGFYLWNGGRLGSGRVYLPASAGAPEFLSLDENATGIKTIANSQEPTANGQYYNLNGQRVGQPTKGLYIVNGKKVIIK